MKIPDCYEAFGQAERRALEQDRQESRREKCGCCGRVIEVGEWFFTVHATEGSFLLCRCCKDDVDESESLMEEVQPC